MKAIETFYHEHLFRSRLEARFAVFWDALSETWEYEKQGYELDGDNYLPDFYLPRMKSFVEIKGEFPNEKAIRLCRKLQFHTEQSVAIFYGLPAENEGFLFGWDQECGGRFTEQSVEWGISDGSLILTDAPGESKILTDAAIRAKCARFEYGQQPEFRASKPFKNIVDYDALPF